jgi:hypothetical protein
VMRRPMARMSATPKLDRSPAGRMASWSRTFGLPATSAE